MMKSVRVMRSSLSACPQLTIALISKRHRKDRSQLLMMMVSIQNSEGIYLLARNYHKYPYSLFLVAVIGSEQGVVYYNVTERLDDSVWISLRLNGEKGPGRQCEVEVRTMDGTADGKLLLQSIVALVMIQTLSVHSWNGLH